MKRKASEAKIEAFVDTICKRFQKAFYHFQNVYIDEMVIPHIGRWKYGQSQKTSKNRMTMWSLCDGGTGSCYNTVTYIDIKTSDFAFCGQSKGIFEHLIKTLDKDCYTFFWQVYHSTFNLLFHLIKRPLQHRYSSINLEKISKQNQTWQ